MFPAEFEYIRPENLKEAVKLLGVSNGLTVIAGGQSLIPALKSRKRNPKGLVDIGGFDELRRIDKVGDKIRIGALATYAILERDETIGSQQPVLREASSQIADPLVRNVGTIGGGLVWADPVYDFPALMLVLNSSMIVVGGDGERRIEATSFFVEPFKSALKSDEILTGVEVPIKGRREGYAYHKFRKGSGGFSITGAASYLSLGEDDIISDCRLAITAPPSKAFRAIEAERWLIGKGISAPALEHVAKLAADEVRSTDPFRASLGYTHSVLLKLIPLALKTAFNKSSEAE